MNFNDLKQLQGCCDQAAFEQLQQPAQTAQQQLEQRIEQQQALFRVTASIQENTDLEAVLSAATIEIRQILHADRVAIFRFGSEPDWSHSNEEYGECIAEDAAPDYPAALTIRIQNDCFSGCFPKGFCQDQLTEPSAVERLAKSSLAQNLLFRQTQALEEIDRQLLSDRQLEVFNILQIQASLTVPLFQGKTQWGLLCLHQRQRRDWQTSEIDFVNQMALQLSVALQQAALVEQTQQQTAELTQAAETLRQNQAQLLQSEKLSCLGQLVAGVAHEINNPVNFIHGNLAHVSCYAQALIDILTAYQQEYPQPSPALQHRMEEVELDFLMEDFPKILSSMQLGTDRIRKIVLSLRNFSRLDETEMKPVDIHAGLDSTLLILQHRLKLSTGSSRGIKIVKEYGDLPLVECHVNQLNQVFMNLLNNAIDALEEQMEASPTVQPQILIRTLLIPEDSHGGSPRAVIQIADNGPGIPESLQSQLFNSFFTTKPIGKGTGLGLSISHQIVTEGHAGEIQCYSQPGQGTEFWIEIPIQQRVCHLDSTLPPLEQIWQPARSKVKT